MKQLAVSFEPEVRQILEGLAKESSISVSAVVNCIVLKYLAEERKITMEKFDKCMAKVKHKSTGQRSFDRNRKLIDEIRGMDKS